VTSDPLDILLAHYRWANREVLAACRAVSEEQFHQRFEMGLGSLHGTMVHVVRCVDGWCACVRGESWPEAAEGPFTPDELIVQSDASADLVAALAQGLCDAGRLGDVHKATGRSGTLHFTSGGAITHCLVHATHHRAQALNMLRQLGVDPLPWLDVFRWQSETERPT